MKFIQDKIDGFIKEFKTISINWFRIELDDDKIITDQDIIDCVVNIVCDSSHIKHSKETLGFRKPVCDRFFNVVIIRNVILVAAY